MATCSTCNHTMTYRFLHGCVVSGCPHINTLTGDSGYLKPKDQERDRKDEEKNR